jgi:hypothetical protein
VAPVRLAAAQAVAAVRLLAAAVAKKLAAVRLLAAGVAPEPAVAVALVHRAEEVHPAAEVPVRLAAGAAR